MPVACVENQLPQPQSTTLNLPSPPSTMTTAMMCVATTQVSPPIHLRFFTHPHPPQQVPPPPPRYPPHHYHHKCMTKMMAMMGKVIANQVSTSPPPFFF